MTHDLSWKRRCLVGIYTAAVFAVSAEADTLQLLSTSDPAQPAAGGGGDSTIPVLSSNGRFVLFASSANNLALNAEGNPIPGTRPAWLSVYRRNRTNATTVLVSADVTGLRGGEGDSMPLALSADGRYALFESTAGNLVPGDTNRMGDIFVRDLVRQVTTLVSANTNGTVGNGVSSSAVMTPDGRYVAFVSEASDLVERDTNYIADVFVRDLVAGRTTLVSVGAMRTNRNSTMRRFGSEAPEITPDGRYVLFRSAATNLLPGVDLPEELYLRDLAAGATTWVSREARAAVQAALGTNDAASFNYLISDDGQWVAYEAAPPQGNTGVILRYSTLTDSTQVVGTDANVPLANYEDICSMAMTPDGRYLAYVANTNSSSSSNTCIVVWDAQSGTTGLASGDLNGLVPDNSFCDSPGLDAAGRRLVFRSNAAGLVTNTTGWHLYARDLPTTAIVLVDADTNGLAPGSEAVVSFPQLSADGRWVAFAYPDGNLVANDRNRDYDVFIRDLATGTTELVSARDSSLGSTSGNGNSSLSLNGLSYDGRFLAYSSEADNIVANDTNGCRDVFLQDLAYHTNWLVSVATNDGGANAVCSEPSVSAGGRWVAFTSAADNLVAGDANKAQDVFVRDMLLGTTMLVSVKANGTGPGNRESSSPVLSGDGRYVLFRSRAVDLAAVPGLEGEHFFLRDLQTGQTRALAKTSVACAAAMTPDGRYVAVIEGRDSIGGYTLYLWDSASGQAVYTNSPGYSGIVAVSRDGNRIACGGSSSNPWPVYIVDWRSNSTRIRPCDGYCGALRFSADGQFLAYAASVWGTRTRLVYLYDYQADAARLLSHVYGSTNAGQGLSDLVDISSDGRYVAYRSAVTNLVPSDANGAADLFLYDRISDATTLVSASRYANATADHFSLQPVFSGNGLSLVFESFASDIAAQDFNQSSDVFLLDLAGSSTNSLVAPLIVPATLVGRKSSFSWLLTPGQDYKVQFKDNLIDAEWRDLGGATARVGTRGYFSDPKPTGPRRFYRIVSY